MLLHLSHFQLPSGMSVSATKTGTDIKLAQRSQPVLIGQTAFRITIETKPHCQ
ncbi:hypothetical protein Hanom_Chr16g01415601 [Helianthus anomalus]